MINIIMPKSIPVNKIRRRRPGAGRPPVGPFVGVRLPQELIDKIDLWADRECDGSRSEAIRRLLEIAFKTEAQRTAKPKPRPEKGKHQ